MDIFIHVKIKYTKELLESTVSESKSMIDLIRKLNVKYTGGTYSHIKSKMIRWGIDFSHFSRKGVNKNKPSTNKLHWRDVLIDNRLNRKEDSKRLRNALIESGEKYECKNCGCGPSWNNQPLVIQIDHIDGNPKNNTKENLRFLCPNCHSQTNNFGSKNRSRNF